MKGLVFTEFLELVEREFSVSMAEAILEETDPPSGGAYTAVGFYDHAELVAMVESLSRRTGIPAADLLRTYGRALFPALYRGHPKISESVTSTFDLLRHLDQHIHREVRKLYPDAELPEFDASDTEAGEIRLVYRSRRAFGDLAYGLIEGSAAHFGESLEIERRSVTGDGTHEEFIVRRR